ncbi:MAG TPA: hypothetical protein VJA47_04695 [archaeon]|nr:hypothetical protein [archaeon]
MKGGLEQVPYIFTFILFILIAFMLWIGLVEPKNQLTSEVLQPTVEKQALGDGTKIFESCLKDKGEITPELIESKSEGCRERAKLDFVKITNIETGKEWTFGDGVKGKHKRSIVTTVKSGENVESAVIYAQA